MQPTDRGGTTRLNCQWRRLDGYSNKIMVIKCHKCHHHNIKQSSRSKLLRWSLVLKKGWQVTLVAANSICCRHLGYIWESSATNLMMLISITFVVTMVMLMMMMNIIIIFCYHPHHNYDLNNIHGNNYFLTRQELFPLWCTTRCLQCYNAPWVKTQQVSHVGDYPVGTTHVPHPRLPSCEESSNRDNMTNKQEAARRTIVATSTDLHIGDPPTFFSLVMPTVKILHCSVLKLSWFISMYQI